MRETIWGIPRQWYRRLFYLSIVVTFIMMLVKVPHSSAMQLISDKQAHFIMFFAITLLCSRGMRESYGLKTILWLILLGFTIEAVQWFVPWRSFSWRDWFADIAGILSYHILFLIKARFKQYWS